MAGEFTQFDSNGFMKVGIRDVEKALGDMLMNAIARSEEIRTGLASQVDAAKTDLAAIVGAGTLGPLSAGMLSLIELNENRSTGQGLHGHQALYYRVDDWPAAVGLGVPVTLGPPGGPALVVATWDSPAYLGLSDWSQAPNVTPPQKGRVATAGVMVLTGALGAFSPGDTVYVGGDSSGSLTKESDVPVGKYLVPVGIYLGLDALKLVSAPAKLKTA